MLLKDKKEVVNIKRQNGNESKLNRNKKDQEHFRGSLIGGAIGDALGHPVEFMNCRSILDKFGEEGITDLVSPESGLAEITDDTQMTLFTAEGLIRAEARWTDRGICHPPRVVYHAYLRWLATQGYSRLEDYDWIYDGWLLGIKELHKRRAPGSTCLSALASVKMGDPKNPINNSKGCGGVMRAAPAGLVFSKEKAFEMGMEFAAITHGHPSGYLPAGALAFIVASIINGEDLQTAVNDSIKFLKSYRKHEESSASLKQAKELAQSDLKDVDAICRLGEGWIGEEALAISVYCALKYRNNFSRAVIAAVNHSGDSDSTGAITGNILGAYLGLSSIPEAWVEKLELKDVIMHLADDLLTGYEESREWREKYPGY